LPDREELLSVILVRYGKFLTAMLAARSQHSTTILSLHSLTEAVLVHSSAIVGLKCSFHFILLFVFVIFIHFGVQK